MAGREQGQAHIPHPISAAIFISLTGPYEYFTAVLVAVLAALSEGRQFGRIVLTSGTQTLNGACHVNLADLDFTLSAKLFAALFAIMNPLTIIPVFLSLTADRSPAERRSTMVVLNLTVAVGCLICALGGSWVLAAFGIDVTHFQLAGGLIVLLLALSMLSGEEHSSHAGTEQEKKTFDTASSLGVYPLGIPLSIGPGSMTTIIVFSQTSGHPGSTMGFYIGLIGYVVFFSICMAAAPIVSRFLSTTALSISKRLMGIVLAAIAMEMIATALGHLFPRWVS